jgi:hypothetical protein
MVTDPEIANLLRALSLAVMDQIEHGGRDIIGTPAKRLSKRSTVSPPGASPCRVPIARKPENEPGSSEAIVGHPR